MAIRNSKTPVHGWLILDKPKGLTSTQALGKARRLLEGGKVGHGGTLDPLATGILPLAFGEATKLIPYVMDGDKEYEFSVRWGEARDTGDAEGKPIATSAKRPTAEAIQTALPAFIGRITQTPPAFSAIKINGERAYDIARAGGTPDIKPREVTVHSFELVSTPDPDTATFRVHCGKGVYVRVLAEDLAIRLGTYGYIIKLRRTRVGAFTLAQAVTLDKLDELGKKSEALTALLPLKLALDHIPSLMLSVGEAQLLRTGMGVLIRPQHGDVANGDLFFAEYQNVPVALAEAKAGEFRSVRGFSF
jgi:tRNA pseudouridine55 synthase